GRGLSVVKPNRSEAFHAAGIPLQESDADDKALKKVGAALLQKWRADLVLITLGEEGMMLFQRNQKPHHAATKARQVFDVSGAGDTAVALFTLHSAVVRRPWRQRRSLITPAPSSWANWERLPFR